MQAELCLAWTAQPAQPKKRRLLAPFTVYPLSSDRIHRSQESLEAANAWLPGYVRDHNQRFAVKSREPADMHRCWQGTAAQLGDICALHFQRQLSAQQACRFQGQILELNEGQAHAPKSSAMVDIAKPVAARVRTARPSTRAWTRCGRRSVDA